MSGTDMISVRAQIANQKGLHARAAAKFVKTAGGFDADVRVSKGEMDVSGGSIMGLMMLAAGPGADLTIYGHGDGAEAAVEALARLVAAGFDED